MTKVANLVYGSVCRGIGAGEVAWEPQGSRCAFLSEIDKFPCAVLAHRLGAGTHGPRRSLNMERTSPEEDMRDVVTQAIVLLQMAERAGFHSAWSAEHHCVFRGNWTDVPEQTDRAFRSKLVNPRSEATQDADYVLS